MRAQPIVILITTALLGGCLEVVPDDRSDAAATDAASGPDMSLEAGPSEMGPSDMGPDADMEPELTPSVCPEGWGWPLPETAPPAGRPSMTDPMWSPTVIDLNCDGYDDVVLPIPTAGAVDIWYGSAEGLGARGGTLDLGLDPTERPYAVHVADHDPATPGYELLVQVLDDVETRRWALVGARHTGEGRHGRVGRHDLDVFVDDLPFQDFHLTTGDVDGVPPLDVVVGRDEAVFSVGNLDWSAGEAGFALATQAPVQLFTDDSGVRPIFSAFLTPYAAPALQMVVVSDSTLIEYHYNEDERALLHSGLFGLDSEQRTVSTGGFADIDGDGQPEVLSVGSRAEGDLWIAQRTTTEDPPRDWQGYLMPTLDLANGFNDGRLDGLTVGNLYGDDTPDLIILDRPSQQDPEQLDPGGTVWLYVARDPQLVAPTLGEDTGVVTPLETTRYTLTADVPFIWSILGRFGSGRQVWVIAPDGRRVCFAPEEGAERGRLVACGSD
ncbi:MAG: hypothetical protein ACE366_11425 [Bradymonadia bacterium]